MTQRFWKYEGAGNDFVLIDGRSGNFNPDRETVARLCDRHFGVGADGLMILEDDSEGGEFRMRYFNADGGESTMCGNGGRCIALFALHLGICGEFKRFNSIDGFHEVRLTPRGEDAAWVELGMINVEGVVRNGKMFFLNTGSPHLVVFVDDVDAVDVFREGGRLRHDERFASGGGTNVNFVDIKGNGEIRVRTFERGVEDETLACGTGVTAASIATRLYAQPQTDRFRITARGGELGVTFSDAGGEKFRNVVLSGPARRVFEGEIEIKEIY